MQDKIVVLYVDDDVYNLDWFKANFQLEFEILTAGSAREGLEILKTNPVEIVISDFHMPEMTGVEFLSEIRKSYTEPVRILVADHSNVTTIVNAVNEAQIYYYLTKPWDKEQLRTAVRAGHEIFSLRSKNQELIELITDVNKQMEALLLLSF